MIVKVCGLKYIDNLTAVANLSVDMVGLNFYKPSKRYMKKLADSEMNLIQEMNTSTVGVFVNDSLSSVMKIRENFNLDYVQLHGDEDNTYCEEIKKVVNVIKVFGVDATFDFDETEKYTMCDYFLFDTKDICYGGTGRKFNWQKLNEYKGETPFILAGGIAPGDEEEIRSIDHPSFIGIDINSKFETSPGEKDVKIIENFIGNIKSK